MNIKGAPCFKGTNFVIIPSYDEPRSDKGSDS